MRPEAIWKTNFIWCTVSDIYRRNKDNRLPNNTVLKVKLLTSKISHPMKHAVLNKDIKPESKLSLDIFISQVHPIQSAMPQPHILFCRKAALTQSHSKQRVRESANYSSTRPEPHLLLCTVQWTDSSLLSSSRINSEFKNQCLVPSHSPSFSCLSLNKRYLIPPREGLFETTTWGWFVCLLAFTFLKGSFNWAGFILALSCLVSKIPSSGNS